MEKNEYYDYRVDPFGVYKIKDTLFYDDTNINFLLTIIEKPQ